MSFYGSASQGGGPAPGQRGSVPSHNLPGSQSNPVDVLPSQIFNFAPNQLQFQTGAHNISFSDPSSQIQMQNIQLAGGAQQLLLHQQQQNFPNLNVNFLTEQIGVGQILQPPNASQNQQIPVQNLITPMSVALTGVSFAQPIQAQPPTATSQASPQAKQRVFTGTVTKTHDNFGFIDEEVFFQMSVVKGVVLPKPGDRVLVEADFNPAMPFKWNATRVQIVNIGGLNNNLPNMNLNPGGKPPSPQPMPHGSQPASLLPQHNSATTGTNLLNLNFNQNHSNSQKNNPPNQNPQGGLASGGHPQNQSQNQGPPRYPPGGNPVSIVSNPHSAYSLRNNGRVEDPGRGLGVQRPQRTRHPPPNIPGGAPSMVSLSTMVDPHSVQHIQLPLPIQLPLSVPLQIPSLLQLDQRDGDKLEREREMRERDRERERDRDRDRQEREREKEHERRDRERERECERSLEREKEREKERDREYERKRERERERDREREKQKRISNDIKRERDKDRERDKRESPPRAPRTRSPISLIRESRKRSRSRSKGREKEKDGRERSKSRSNSPKRPAVTARPPPRYGWELPKYPLDVSEVGVSELKRRYRNLYIPSDFILARCAWQDTFPLHKTLDLTHSCGVHLFRRHTEKLELKEMSLKPKVKEVEPIPNVLNPPDESDTLKVKVILMSVPPKTTLYRKTCGLAEEASDNSLQHPCRLINFMVGTKMARNEAMLIGGSWSPSLDGANPDTNPQVLINTAIRTTKNLTGLDLRRCTKWYRFMELYYRRGNGTIETVIIFLPNIWTAVPSRREWEDIQRSYKEALVGDSKENNNGPLPEDKGDNTRKLPAKGQALNLEGKEGESTQSAAAAPAPDDSGKEGGEDVVVGIKLETKPAVGKAIIPAAPMVKMEAPLDEAQAVVEVKQEMGKRDEDVDIYEDLPPPPPAGPQLLEKTTMTGDDDLSCGKTAAGVNGRDEVVGVIGNAENPTEQQQDVERCCGEAGSEDGGGTCEKDELQKISAELPMEEEDGEKGAGGSGVSVPVLKQMTVQKLKEQLELRGAATRGLKKNQLVTRLTKILKNEESSEVRSKGEKSEDKQYHKDEPMDVPLVESSSSLPVPNGLEKSLEDKESLKCDGEGRSTVGSTENTLDTSGSERGGIIERREMMEQDRLEGLTSQQQQINMMMIKPDPTSVLSEGKSGNVPSVRCKRVGFTYQVPVLSQGTIEKTRKVWERRYALPKSPHLLVHPSSEAKSGIFDCNQHSLHTLRDYRLADNKEQSFEVSLCSEFVHEMLQRDFAFRIYRELVYNASVNGQDEKDDKCPVSVLPKDESPAKKRKISTSSCPVLPSNGKAKTVDPYLLLAFVFFDHTRCGYITDSDLEELCLSLGLGLSRSQVRKMVQKVCTKGSLHYRKWTDLSQEDGIVSECVPRTDGTEENLMLLANAGNKSSLPIYGKPRIELQDLVLHPADGENLKKETESLLAACDSDSGLVDSKQLRDQLERSEKDRSVLDANLNLVKSSLSEAKGQVLELKKSNDALKEELNRTKDLVKKFENSEASAQAELDILRKAAERFIDRVKDVVKVRPACLTYQDG